MNEQESRRELPKCHPELRKSNHCLAGEGRGREGSRGRDMESTQGMCLYQAPSRKDKPADLVSSYLVGGQTRPHRLMTGLRGICKENMGISALNSGLGGDRWPPG